MPLNVELLESSFLPIKAQETKFTNHFYTKLLTDYPEVKPLFAHTNMEKQGQQLFKSLVLVVDNLRSPEELSNLLKGLGTRHVKYGVLPSHYPMVGGALLNTLATCLEAAWTTETEKAWTEAYTAITQLMLSGTEYPEETLNPNV
jgi:hemoglobin-like flavoprotein